MANNVRMEIHGMDHLRKTFSQLPSRVERRVIVGAVNRAATPIVSAMRRYAPVELGHLKRQLGKRVKAYRQNSIVFAAIGVRSRWIPVPKSVRWTKTGKVNPAFYVHLVEDHVGTHRGFMRRGFDAAKGKTEQVFLRAFAAGVEREARKLGWK